MTSAATCGSEAWRHCKGDVNTFVTWGSKILRRIFGPAKENGVWKIRTNQELMALYREPDIISGIIKGRLRWLGQVERMPEVRTTNKVF
jgi:hypothetical protein